MAVKISSLTSNSIFANNVFVELQSTTDLLDMSLPYTLMARVRRLSTSSTALTAFFGIGKSDRTAVDSIGASNFGSNANLFSYYNTSGTGDTRPIFNDTNYWFTLRRTAANRLEAFYRYVYVAIPSATGIDAGTDTFTSVAHGFTEAERIIFLTISGSTPGGLANNNPYYIRNVTPDTFQLSNTPAGGTIIDITGAGTGTHSLYSCPVWNTDFTRPANTMANMIRLFGNANFGTSTGQSNVEVVYDCVRLYNTSLSVPDMIAEQNSRTAVRTANLLVDVQVCAPGDFLSYAGTKTLTVPQDTIFRNTSLSIQSYGDLIAGGSDPIISFFGDRKLIIINGLSNSNMTVDAEYIYSRWKEWVAAGNAQYMPAFRTIGGDPIGGGTEVGSYFFLRNDSGWRIQPKGHLHELTITGNLYPEDSNTAMFDLPGDAFPVQVLIKQQVSSLTQAIPTGAAALTVEQATQLDEIHKIHGLNPAAPLVVDQTSRAAGTGIEQTITKGPGPIGEEPITITRD